MKINYLFQVFCIFILAGCTQGDIKQPTKPSNYETLTPSTLPSNDTHSPITPTIVATVMPVQSSRIIGKDNLAQLALLHSWDVDNVFLYRSANFWFSDSNQFVVPNSDGLQSFTIDGLTPAWVLKSLALDFTIDNNDQVIINLKGLQIFTKQGADSQTIRTNQFCDMDEPPSNYILAIPGTNLVVTGHQDSYSDFGINGVGYDKARILIWDISRNSCIELIRQFDGVLTSLSVSDDGNYISYVVLIKTENSPKSSTRIYDLGLRKEKCEFSGGLFVNFIHQDQFAIYDARDETISLVNLADCTVETRFNVGSEILNAFVISPDGKILAGITNHVILFWDIQTGKKIREVDPEGYVLSIIGFSPDGRFLVTAKRADSLVEKDKVMLWGLPEN